MVPHQDDRESLLAVFAHPDDESLACGGLLAWSASLGVRVSVLCLTRGELRQPRTGAGVAAEDRARELRAAAEVLGVDEVIQCDFRDGFLPWEDPAALEQAIRDAIVRLRPDVVVTFDGDGLYWHPDHIAVHECTIGAVRALGDLAPALYFVSMPQGRMRRALEAAQAASEGDPEGSARQVLDVDVDAFGAEAPPAALALEVGAFAARKLQALRRHRSQLAGDPLDHLPEEDASRVLGLELYRRADVGSQAETFLDRLGSPAETIWVDGEDLEG